MLSLTKGNYYKAAPWSVKNTSASPFRSKDLLGSRVDFVRGIGFRDLSEELRFKLRMCLSVCIHFLVLDAKNSCRLLPRMLDQYLHNALGAIYAQ
jgi:hypothetical protein